VEIEGSLGHGPRLKYHPAASFVAIAVGGGLAALAGTIGADSRWAVVLGQSIARTASVPDGVPFAAAPSAGWPNVPVLGELTFGGAFWALQDRGLEILQVGAVVAGLELLRRAMLRNGGNQAGAAAALLLVVVGAFPDLVVVRLQLFSLALFPLLLLLLHRPEHTWSSLTFTLAPLFALWSNLHGAMLVGLGVMACYLVFERLNLDSWRAGIPLLACALASFVTPAGLETPLYYLGVAQNEAARAGFGLWAPLSPSRPFNVVMVMSAVALGIFAMRGRLRRWEVAASILLASSTLHTARTGVWLLMLLAVPAASGLGRAERYRRPLLNGALLAVCVAMLGVGLVHGPLVVGASDALISRAVTLAAGTPIVADGLLAEQVAVAGGTVWMSNPLDAFPRQDQRLYVSWLRGTAAGDGALAHAPRVVLVTLRTPAALRLAQRSNAGALREAARDERAILYVRAR
jgi:hypothetical protein